jgi:hypothetical protein
MGVAQKISILGSTIANVSFFLVRLKFQKRGALKFVSRTIPRKQVYNPRDQWKFRAGLSLFPENKFQLHTVKAESFTDLIGQV